MNIYYIGNKDLLEYINNIIEDKKLFLKKINSIEDIRDIKKTNKILILSSFFYKYSK